MSDQDSPIPVLCYHWACDGVVYGMKSSNYMRCNGNGSISGFECDFSGDYYMGVKVQWGPARVNHWI